MRTHIEDAAPEDAKRCTEAYLWAEVARCAVLDPAQTFKALKDELNTLRDMAMKYDLDDEKSFEYDPVYQAFYYPRD